jgi:hypothetical protein
MVVGRPQINGKFLSNMIDRDRSILCNTVAKLQPIEFIYYRWLQKNKPDGRIKCRVFLIAAARGRRVISIHASVWLFLLKPPICFTNRDGSLLQMPISRIASCAWCFTTTCIIAIKCTGCPNKNGTLHFARCNNFIALDCKLIGRGPKTTTASSI